MSVHISEKALDTLGNILDDFFLRFEDVRVCVRACVCA